MMNQYGRLVRFVLPHAKVLIMAAVCMLISSIFTISPFTMIIPLVDKIIAGKAIIIPHSEMLPQFVRGLIDKINSMPRMELLNSMAMIFIVMWLLKNLFEFLQSYLMNDVSQRVIRDMKNTIYQKLLTLSMDFYSKNSTGKLMSRVTNDSAIIRDSISTGLTDLIYQPIQLVICLAAVLVVKVYFSISWTLLGIIAVVFLLVIYPVVKIGKRLKRISTQSQENMADITTTLHETISGVRVVKAFSMEPYESDKFAAQNQRFYKLMMKSVKRMTLISPMTEFVEVFSLALILWFAGKDIISGALSAGAFIAFTASFFSMMRPAKRLANVYAINQQAMAAADRIFEVLDMKPSVAEKPGAMELPRINTGVKIENVRFRYEDKDILKGITFNVRAGDIVAFVGPSGTGKTTLVNLIPRFYDVTSGRIMIDGTDIRDCTLKSLIGQIGIVTQETILFNDTVGANIAYGSKGHSQADIVKAAKIANAHDFISKLPKGYDTIVGERGFRLSGGEKQRLAIARAVFKDPPILILDEATSQLDTESEALVQEAIDRMMKGRTVFVIAHRLSTIKHATTIHVLDGGNIAASGSHDELIQKDGLYKRLYDMQFKDNILK
ncbi:MAG: ABC transporter ATP-binding protein [Candidatus Omnitrophota bacterium]|jgi:subfamily B ATP-binding cassette protein MsbA